MLVFLEPAMDEEEEEEADLGLTKDEGGSQPSMRELCDDVGMEATMRGFFPPDLFGSTVSPGPLFLTTCTDSVDPIFTQKTSFSLSLRLSPQGHVSSLCALLLFFCSVREKKKKKSF